MSAIGSTHTEGPWEYDAESMQVIAPKCGYQGPGTPVVCEVGSLKYGESHKNGLLLGAATDMLAALTRIDEWNRRVMESGGLPARGITEIQLAEVRAAIAKAAGRAS